MPGQLSLTVGQARLDRLEPVYSSELFLFPTDLMVDSNILEQYLKSCLHKRYFELHKFVHNTKQRLQIADSQFILSIVI